MNDPWPGGDEFELLESVCSDEGHTIAPIPSSIISQEEERNQTVSIPEPMTSIGSADLSLTGNILTRYDTPTVTRSLDAAGPTNSLPLSAAATKSNDVAFIVPGIMPWFVVASSATWAALW